MNRDEQRVAYLRKASDVVSRAVKCNEIALASDGKNSPPELITEASSTINDAAALIGETGRQYVQSEGELQVIRNGVAYTLYFAIVLQITTADLNELAKPQ